MKRLMIVLCVAAVVGLASAAAQAAIEWVTVGNPGNTGELSGTIGGRPQATVGAVGYEYKIGKYEVTAGQYTAFLNAVAKTDDPYGLYNTKMGSTNATDRGCNIQRTGGSGSYSYSVADAWANRPVNYVSWGDAARFANWMTSGQTEVGSYTLNGATDYAGLHAVTRNANAQYVIPTEDEWYKAAYYDPLKSGGPGYWDFIGTDAQSGTSMTEATNPGNNANYNNMLGAPYYRTLAGEFELSDSFYGTFDQLGNVSEWNETIIYYSSADQRGYRGGPYGSTIGALSAESRLSFSLTYELNTMGFRVAELDVPPPVPEPASVLVWGLLGLVAAGYGVWRRKRAA